MLSKLQIINEIGHGSFGNVKKVRNKKNNKIFALKEIELNSRLELNKNLKEIRNLYSIQSPYVVSYYESYFDEKNLKLYILMEYIEGENLEKKINNNRKLNRHFSENFIWQIFIQLLVGLDHLEKRKIHHHDLKPANIIIKPNNQIKIIDLGLGDVITREEKKYFFCGTRRYMSSEIFFKNKGDFNSDIWSLGVIMYEMITLKIPKFFENKYEESFIKNELMNIYENNLCCKSHFIILLILLTKDEKKRISAKKMLQLNCIQKQIQNIKRNSNILNHMNSVYGNDIDSFNIDLKSNVNKYLPKNNYYNSENEFEDLNKFIDKNDQKILEEILDFYILKGIVNNLKEKLENKKKRIKKNIYF